MNELVIIVRIKTNTNNNNNKALGINHQHHHHLKNRLEERSKRNRTNERRIEFLEKK